MISDGGSAMVGKCSVLVSGGEMEEAEANVYIQLKRQQYQHAPSNVHFIIKGESVTAIWSYNDVEDTVPRLTKKSVKDIQPMLSDGGAE